MPSKPKPTVRRPPAGSSKQLRAVGRDVDTELAVERIARKHERPHDDDAPVSGRGVHVMRGRALADGTRKGARVTRRITFYLSPEVAGELAVRAAKQGRKLSEVADQALAEAFGL